MTIFPGRNELANGKDTCRWKGEDQGLLVCLKSHSLCGAQVCRDELLPRKVDRCWQTTDNSMGESEVKCHPLAGWKGIQTGSRGQQRNNGFFVCQGSGHICNVRTEVCRGLHWPSLLVPLSCPVLFYHGTPELNYGQLPMGHGEPINSF